MNRRDVDATDIRSSAVAEQNVVRHHDGAAATGFQGANGVLQEGHGPDTFTGGDREIRAVHVARHLVEGRVGEDQVRFAHVLALWGAAVFAAHEAFNTVRMRARRIAVQMSARGYLRPASSV